MSDNVDAGYVADSARKIMYLQWDNEARAQAMTRMSKDWHRGNGNWAVSIQTTKDDINVVSAQITNARQELTRYLMKEEHIGGSSAYEKVTAWIGIEERNVGSQHKMDYIESRTTYYYNLQAELVLNQEANNPHGSHNSSKGSRGNDSRHRPDDKSDKPKPSKGFWRRRSEVDGMDMERTVFADSVQDWSEDPVAPSIRMSASFIGSRAV